MNSWAGKMAEFCSKSSFIACPEGDRIVCRCLQVTESELIETLCLREIRTVHDIRQVTGAGDGCTACHSLIKQYIEEHREAACAQACR